MLYGRRRQDSNTPALCLLAVDNNIDGRIIISRGRTLTFPRWMLTFHDVHVDLP